MNKGLEALKRIKMLEISCDRESYDLRPITKTHKEDLSTIEKELKEKAKFDAFMKRYNIDSVEELDTFFNEHLNNDIDKCSKCKELKALEIIKEKGIILQFIKETYTVEQYNAGVFGTLVKPLTQEEYTLLKEVLL